MNKLNPLLTRRVEKILPSKEALSKLINQQGKIRLFQGFDPTGTNLHLGHTIGLKILMDFAKAGHEVIFLFGTGTVLVGDPSKRDTGRKLITQEEIEANIKTWKQQVEPIVDFNLVTSKQNGDWLIPLTLPDIINIASHISSVQLFKRESFTRRIKRGDTVWYHETMYPLLQGYDSVVMDVDLEIGGTDQEFNMLIGRELQKKMNHREKFVLTIPMINGTDGHSMSKTRGNCIWLNDNPNNMYGKLMRLNDNQIAPYMRLLTDIPLLELKSLPDNPLENKKRLALDITTQFHGVSTAQMAQKHFETTVQQKKAPLQVTLVNVEAGQTTLLNLCQQLKVGDSNAQIKRTISQGGVEVNNLRITDFNHSLTPQNGDIVKFGKRTYRQLTVN